MKKFVWAVPALIVAVLFSYALGASAGRSDLALDAQREPVYVPNPAQYTVLQCGEQRSLALISHWPSPFHTEYVARFRAHGNLGTVALIRQQPEWLVAELRVPPEPNGNLMLTVPVVHRSDPLDPSPHWIQVIAGAELCSPPASKGDAPLTLDVNDLNIFVR